MQIIAIIPARGGSKRVPKKNIKLLNDIPLISYTIRQALKSKIFDRVIVSTEDARIKEISLFEGAEVFDRPKDLAEDVPSELVIKDVINTLKEKENYNVDIIAMLQPTSPLRKPETIIGCVHALLFDYDKYDSIITTTPISQHPEWMVFIERDGKISPYTNMWLDHNQKSYIKLVASQDLPKIYRQDGCVYVFKKELIMNKGIIIGPKTKAIIISEIEAFDLDTPLDFLVAEHLIRGL